MIDAPVERVFDLYTDPGRFPQWQRGLERVTRVTGPLDQPGSRYTLRAGPKMEMQAEVIDVIPGERHRQRSTGMRTEMVYDVAFAPTAGGTLVTFEVEVASRYGPATGLLSRLNRGNAGREIARELENLKAFVERPEVRAAVGTWYSLDDGGGHHRLAHVIAADDTAVHLQLAPGTYRDRPTAMDTAPNKTAVAPDDPADFKAVEPSIRSAANPLQSGQRLLLLDGGLGIAQFPITPGAFSDAQPEAITTGPVDARVGDLVEGWRSHGSPTFGRDLELRLAPLVTVPQDEPDGPFGVAKILVASWREVHLRFYAGNWPERPTWVDPWKLVLGRIDLDADGDPVVPESIGSGHIPFTRSAYAKGTPRFLQLAILQADELDGYELWKEAGGGRLLG
jgi:uncharacterized protein YndB with AHSA1/START domain